MTNLTAITGAARLIGRAGNRGNILGTISTGSRFVTLPGPRQQ